MQLILEIDQPQDLEILIPLFKRLKISIIEPKEDSNEDRISDKPPMAKHIGKLPSIDVEAFQQYLKQSREEWERPIF